MMIVMSLMMTDIKIIAVKIIDMSVIKQYDYNVNYSQGIFKGIMISEGTNIEQ